MSDNDQAIRDVVKGASVIYVGLFLELVIAFVAQVLAARYLSVSEFGGLTTGTALLSVGAIIGGLGLASGLVRYLPRVDNSEKRALTQFAFSVVAIASLPLGLLVSLNAEFVAATIFDDPTVEASIRVFGAAIPFAALLNVALSGLRGQSESARYAFVQNILHTSVRLLLIITAVTFGLGQFGFATAYAIPYTASLVAAVYFLYRALPEVSESLDQDRRSEVFRYSLPFTITELSSFIYRSVDIFLVLRFLGSAAVGVYGVAYAAVGFMQMFSTAFNFIGTPMASRLESEGDVSGMIKVYRSIARWLAIASVCALFPLGVFSTEFISVIYGGEYAEGGLVLTILAIGYAASNVLNVHGPLLRALGKSKLLSFNSAAAAISNVAFNIILIPTLGIMGAAIATGVSFIIRDGMATIQIHYYTNRTPLSRATLTPVLISLPFVALAVLIRPIIPVSFVFLVLISGLFSIAYVLVILSITGLFQYEIMILRSIEEKYEIDSWMLDILINRFS
ncbi:oligosaccharide flippase family protein [Natronosalvus caseinilyticus]|uniref:oligosaccharide flippase family protein n=1 Tax=Natronosalvus caseinilyticus TaxID=2953747 RepID=UPI0028AB2491|nr:oligosaccharide flippase family protein [Natronosalvus caseinilyticus]